MFSIIRNFISKFADKKLLAENAKLSELLTKRVIDETTIDELIFRSNQISGTLEGGFSQIIAESFAEQFANSEALNYLEIGFVSTRFMPGEHLLVTIQKTSGKTPHQFRVEAEEKVKELESKINDLLQTKDLLKCN